MCWPNSLPAQERDEGRTAEDRDDHCDERCDEDSGHQRVEILRDDLESHRARALDQHDVAGPKLGAQPLGRLRRGRDPLAAVGRARARRPRSPARRCCARARRSPRGRRARRRRARPSRRAPPGGGARRRARRGARARRASRPGSRCNSRSAAGRRPAAARSSSRSFENSTCSSPVRQRQAEASTTVSAVRVFSSWCAASSSVANGSSRVARSTRSTRDVVARQVRLEQRLVAARRRCRRPAARRSAPPSRARRSRSSRRARGAPGRRS